MMPDLYNYVLGVFERSVHLGLFWTEDGRLAAGGEDAYYFLVGFRGGGGNISLMTQKQRSAYDTGLQLRRDLLSLYKVKETAHPCG